MSAMTRLLPATPSSACQTDPAAADSFEHLIHALRHPQALFDDMADPQLFTRCEMADWDATTAAMRQILDRYGVTPAQVLAKLRLAAEFMRHHEIPLEGSPWLCTHHDECDIWARFDIHTALIGPDIAVWQDRFDDVVANRDLRVECFQIWLLSRGPH
jgi:hypothetical protein